MVRPSLATVLVALLLSVLGFVAFAASQRARSNERSRAAAAPAAPEAPATPLEPLRTIGGSSTAPKAPPRPPSYSILRVKAGHSVTLRKKPGGSAVTRVGATTQFGSPSTLTVAAQRGNWLGVTSTDFPNGKLAWVRREHDAVARSHTRLAIRIDLSSRRLRLARGKRVLRSARVGIGRPGSPTPTGRYSITDKLNGASYGPYYGCCILALSGHQTNTPAGWRGGDRLAIHGTDNPASIGVPSSAGCLHAEAADLRALMRRVPLGTPVFIRA